MLTGNRILFSVIAGFFTLAVSTCFLPSASAGQYDVWSCRGPADQPLTADAWKVSTSFADPGDTFFTDDCATGGPIDLRLADSGTGSKARINFDLDLPDGVVVTGYRLNRAVRASIPAGPGVYISAAGETTGGTTEDWGCASVLALPYFSCSFEGSDLDPDDPTNQWVRTGLALDGLRVWTGCTTASGCAVPFSPPAAYYVLWGSRVTLEENVDPAVVSIGGTLTQPGAHRGEANLFVRATDEASGVALMDLEIDGIPHQSININAARCVEPYEVADPCPADAGRIFTVDRSALTPGIHVATGTVTDAAGNQAPFGPVNFQVAAPDPGPPDPPDPPDPPGPDNGTPAVAQPVISPSADVIWHRPGKAAAVVGTLETDTGLPVSGATLEARLTPVAVTAPKPAGLADVTTAADGSFRVPVPGQGARRVEISFRPYAGSEVTATAEVLVRGRLALSLKPRPKRIRIGKRVTFKGRLAGAGPSAGGVPVEVQAKMSGHWETVATVRSRKGGAWTWRYRFKYVKRNAIFSFRAIVRGAPGWPWPMVKSPVRKVRISVVRR